VKIIALALVVAVLGLPISDLLRFALLVIATVLVMVDPLARSPRRWLAAIAVTVVCVPAQILIEPPAIEEGHNVFVVDGPGGALETGLPRDAFRIMAAEFDARYPPEHRCDSGSIGCWRHDLPDRPFAFSADGSFQRPAYSRQVTGIDFDDPVWLRLGFINEQRYSWNSQVSDVDRASRNRGPAALVHRWKLEMPWFVMYRFPAQYVGSSLCWRGEVLWEAANERFDGISHATMQCRPLTSEDVGRRIFGVAISERQPLAMRLQPNARILLRQIAAASIAVIGSAAVVGLLLAGALELRRVTLPFALIAVTLAIAFLNDASFIGGLRPLDAGDDGLIYDDFARAMLQQLLAGDVSGALEGGEKVFYFTPGLRYLRMVEHLVFGETYLGYLSLMLLLPFLVFAMFRRFLPPRWTLAVTLIFSAIPIGMLFGSSLAQYIKWAARGFADPAAYVLFLAAFILLVGPTAAGPRNRFAHACGAGLLFALAIFVRPNLAPMTGILLAGAGLAGLWQRQYRRIVGLCIGFLPVLGMALHNWVYGGVFALFTSTTEHYTTLVTPPSVYLAAFAELVRLDFAEGDIVRVLKQIGGWLAGPSESVLMAPLHVAAFAVLVRAAAHRGIDPWLRLTAAALLVQHCVGIFYATGARYYYLTWLLTLLVVTAWVHAEGLALFRRRWPAPAERIAAHPASIALARGLDRGLGLMRRPGWKNREN
jgi:hypothetical protein